MHRRYTTKLEGKKRGRKERREGGRRERRRHTFQHINNTIAIVTGGQESCAVHLLSELSFRGCVLSYQTAKGEKGMFKEDEAYKTP